MRRTWSWYLFYGLLVFMVILGCHRRVRRGADATPKTAWVPITIRATGGGAPPGPGRSVNAAQERLLAERAAKVDAYRNLLEQAYGLTLTSASTVRDFVTESDVIKTRVEAYVRGGKVTDVRHLPDGGVEVDVEVLLGHEFRRIFP